MALESAVERHITRHCTEQGILCHKLVNQSTIGWPDRTLFIPGGIVALAEIKRPTGGVMSKAQLRWQRVLKEMGFRCYVWNNFDEAADEIARLSSGC